MRFIWNGLAAAKQSAFSKLEIMPTNQNYVIARVVNLLNAHGYMAWRQENNGRLDEASAVEKLTELLFALAHVKYDKAKIKPLIEGILRKCYRKVPNSKKGVTDVIGIDLRTGKWICVEIKLGLDRLTPDQEEFMGIVRNAGGSTWLCRDFDSFRTGFLKNHGVADAA